MAGGCLTGLIEEEKMKYPIRIKKKCEVKIDSVLRSFEGGEEIEVGEEEGRGLIGRGLALPAGVQYGRPVRMFDRD
jgi:hypothetical protein